MNTLQIIKTACNTLGYPEIATVEKSREPVAGRLLGALNRAAEEIAQSFNWSALMRRKTFVTDRMSEAYDPAEGGWALDKIAPDFKRLSRPYVYDLTEKREIAAAAARDAARFEIDGGPVQERMFIIRAGRLIFLPQIPGNEHRRICLYYQSAHLARRTDTSGNTHGAEMFEKNEDEALLPGPLLLRGLVWKYRCEMGFDYAESYRDYERMLAKEQDNDGAAPVVSTAPQKGFALHLPEVMP